MRNLWAIWIQLFLILNATTVSATISSSADNGPEHCEERLARHVYAFEPVSFEKVYGSRGGPLLAASNGDAFLSLSHAGQVSLYDFERDKLTHFETGHFEETSDLFESPRSGRVYFAYVTPTQVKVIDARADREILNVALKDVEPLGDLLGQLDSNMPLYRPILFENGGGVHVALVPRNDDLYLDETFVVPLVTLNVRTGEKKYDSVHSGLIRYERMPNGRVYGIGWEREQGGYPNTLMVHDLTSQHTILSEKFAHTQDPPIIAGQLSIFFEKPRRPELVMFLPSPAGKALLYSRADRQFNPIPGLSRALTTSIRFFNEADGKPWFAAIEGSESADTSPAFYRLVIQPMAALTGSIVQEIGIEHPENDIGALEVIERPEGRLFLAWERTLIDGKQRMARVHIYDQARKKLTTVPVPPEWPGASIRRSFWNSAKNSLMTYFVRDDGTEPAFAQLYGPPAERVTLAPEN